MADEMQPSAIDSPFDHNRSNTPTLAMIETVLAVRLRLSDFALTHSFRETLHRALDEGCKLTGSPIGFFHFVGTDTITHHHWFNQDSVTFLSADIQGPDYQIDPSGIWGNCIQKKKAVIQNSTPHRITGYPEGYDAVIRQLCVPIIRAGKPLAILGAANKKENYTGDDAQMLQHFADLAWDIVEAGTSADTLKRCKALLKETQTQTKIGGWEWDLPSQKIHWTDETYKIHGLPPEKMALGSSDHIEKSLLCYHPDDRPVIMDAFESCAQKGIPYDLEFPFTKMTGEKIWIRTIGKPFEEDGTIKKVIGSIMDISDQKFSEHLAEIQLDLSARLGRVKNLDEAIRLCFEASVEVSNLDSGGFYMADEKTHSLNLVYHKGLSDNFIDRVKTYGPHSPNTRLVMQGEPIFTNHAQLRSQLGLPEKKEKFKALAVLPIKFQDNVIGCLNMTSHTLDHVPESSQVALKTISNQIGQSIHQIRMQEELHESEQKFKMLFEKAPLSYQSLDEAGNLAEVNQTWLQTLGYERDAVIGKNFSEFLAPEWKDHFYENFPNFKSIGEVLGIEFEMIKNDGSTILVLFHGKIAASYTGNFERTHCVFTDITLQKIAENRLRKELALSKAVAEISKELLSEIYDIKKVSDLTLNFALKLTRSEHGFVSSIDKETRENVGHTLTDMFGDHCRLKNQRIAFPISNDGHYGALWGHALNTKKPFFTNTPDHHHTSKGLPKGHIPLHNYMAVPIMMGDNLLGLIALANTPKGYHDSDIHHIHRLAEVFALALHRHAYESDRKKIEMSLRQLQKNEAIGALAGGIAHDFNNILFPIVGFSELLMDDIAQDSPLRESVEEIFQGAKRAKELVKQILTFSRQSEEELKPIRPHLIVKEVFKLMKATMPATIEIKDTIDKNCTTIMADPTQLHQIAMNLVTNSYHALLDSGGVLTIGLKNIDRTTTLTHLELNNGPHVLLSVRDTGIGMNQATMDKMFDPYFTTKPKEKGTGLGLSVVYGIVKQYGGDIEVQSQLGVGTTFNIYLPAYRSDKRAEAKPTIDETLYGSEKILLVDDEGPVLKLVETLLKRLGYAVDATDNSLKALDEITSRPTHYDLVVTDMTMPRMTGDIMAQKIRTVNPDLPIIICTGFSERLTPERAAKIGINAVLTKPIIKAELAKAIRDALDPKGHRPVP